jgi:thiol-disulfide isomerase/thioredoxin
MALRLRAPMPSLAGATEWLDGTFDPQSLEGHVTLVHFWAVSCGICKPHLPQVAAWREKYGPQGVKFVSVHMPRQESDTDVAQVRRVAVDHGLTHPTAVDNLHGVAEAFENEYVPAYYVFDKGGTLRLYMSGEKVLPMVQQQLDRLLGQGAVPAA